MLATQAPLPPADEPNAARRAAESKKKKVEARKGESRTVSKNDARKEKEVERKKTDEPCRRPHHSHSLPSISSKLNFSALFWCPLQQLELAYKGHWRGEAVLLLSENGVGAKV